MADGGACSSDPFRLPAAGEELTYPFGNGLVVRYGHTTRLVAKMVAVAGVAAELPPLTEEPYRLLYFVVTDHMRTAIAVLRAALKEGLSAPSRPSKALVIDNLHTLEVFRKQGLATNLANFVKGIAGAHGIGLYASCGLFSRTFWELRGFEEETVLEMISVCNRVDEFTDCTMLLRAGRGYAEYQPGNGERLSIIRPFYHSQYGDVYMDPSIPAASCIKGDDAAAATRFFGEAPVAFPAVSLADGEGAEGGAAAAVNHEGEGAAASAPFLSVVSAAPTPPVLTDASLARHDAEEAKRSSSSSSSFSSSSSAAAAAAGMTSSLVGKTTAGARAAAGAAAMATPVTATGTAQERSALAQRTAAGGWPGITVPTFIGSAGSPGAAAGSLEWPPPHRQSGLDAIAALSADPASEEMAVRALTALPGLRDGAGMSSSVVDLTGGEGGRTLAEQEEEQMQLAIALSLSTGGGGGAGGREGDPPGDDTETDEEPGYGAQVGVGEGGSCGVASEACAAATTAHAENSGTEGVALAAAVPALAVVPAATSSRGLPTVDGGDRRHHGGAGESGSDSSIDGGSSGAGGGGRGRGAVDYGEPENDLRRLRRRRDKGGASTPGEQSPDGADGGDGVTDGEPTERIGGAVGSADGVVCEPWRAACAGGGAGSSNGRPNSTAHSADGTYSNGATPSALAPSPAINTNAFESRPGMDVLDPRGFVGGGENGAAGWGKCINFAKDNGGSHLGNSNPNNAFAHHLPACQNDGGELGGSTLTSGEFAPSSIGLLDVGATIISAPSGGRSCPPPADRVGLGAGPDAMVVSDPEQHKVYVPPPRGLPRQRQHQDQQVPMADNNNNIDAVGVVAPAVEAGPRGDIGSGAFMNDLESDELWRDMGVEPGEVNCVGGGGSGGGDGRGLDSLLAAASWERDDADEDLRRAVEASRQSHEKEMLLRATQESQEAAAQGTQMTEAESATSAAQASPQLTVNNRGAAASRDTTAADAAVATGATASLSTAGSAGGGPGDTVLPPFAVFGAASSGGLSCCSGLGDNGSVSFPGQSGAVYSGGGGGGGAGAGASGWQVAGGQAAGPGAAGAAGGSSVVDRAAWLTGWEDAGEVVGFVGKGKGRCRDR